MRGARLTSKPDRITASRRSSGSWSGSSPWPPLALALEKLPRSLPPPQGAWPHGMGAPGPNVCVITPDWLVTSADLTSWVLGHHATYQPFATVARTVLPSSSVKVTPVTPSPARPSANEYAAPPRYAACELDRKIWPAGTSIGALDWLPAAAVNDGPSMHVTLALSFA